MRPSSTRGNGHKLEHEKFLLYIQKKKILLEDGQHWNRLPREAVESPPFGGIQDLTGKATWI